MIKINDKYYIDSDSLQYILLERNVVSKEGSKHFGEETFKNIGYFGTLESLGEFLLDLEIKENLELLNNIEKIIELKEEIVREVKNVSNK